MAQIKQSKILGINKIMKNLNREIKKIKGRTQAGVTAAAMHLRRESVKLVPIVTGNLRNSVFVTWPKGQSRSSRKLKGKPSEVAELESDIQATIGASKSAVNRSADPVAEVGYGAVYAMSVHENPRSGKTGGKSPTGKAYKPPKGSARQVYSEVGRYKFLEAPMNTEAKKIFTIIKERAKIK